MRRYVVSEYGIRDYGIRDYGIRDYGLRDYGLRDTGFGHSQIIGWNFFFAILPCLFAIFVSFSHSFSFLIFSTNLGCYILKNN